LPDAALTPSRDRRPDSGQPSNRFERRRSSTRAKLIDAGRVVFGEKGLETATIHDITETADVGRGTFYNFFETKEDLHQAIVDEMVEALARLEDEVRVDLETDPIGALVALLERSFDLLVADDVAAWFTVRTQSVGSPLFHRFHDITFACAEKGRATGRFDVEPEVAVVLIASIMLGTLEAVLAGRVDRKVTDEVVFLAIRALGIPTEDARSLTDRRQT
jgi:AcrR family transcriptional regulator